MTSTLSFIKRRSWSSSRASESRELSLCFLDASAVDERDSMHSSSSRFCCTMSATMSCLSASVLCASCRPCMLPKISARRSSEPVCRTSMAWTALLRVVRVRASCSTCISMKWSQAIEAPMPCGCVVQEFETDVALGEPCSLDCHESASALFRSPSAPSSSPNWQKLTSDMAGKGVALQVAPRSTCPLQLVPDTRENPGKSIARAATLVVSHVTVEATHVGKSALPCNGS